MIKTSDNAVKVGAWFARNYVQLLQTFPVVNFKARDAANAVRGAVTIEIDTPFVAASFCFWNKCDVCAIVLYKPTKKEKDPEVIDDRVLGEDEDVGKLLDGYVRKVQALDVPGEACDPVIGNV